MDVGGRGKDDTRKRMRIKEGWHALLELKEWEHQEEKRGEGRD